MRTGSIETAYRRGRRELAGSPGNTTAWCASLTAALERVDRTTWPGPIAALFTGATTPDRVLAVAASADPKTDRARRCEAAFYVAEYDLWRGNRALALRLLERAQATCPDDFIELDGARAELARIPPA